MDESAPQPPQNPGPSRSTRDPGALLLVALLAAGAYGRVLGFAYRSDDFPMIRSAATDEGGVNWARLGKFFSEPLREQIEGRFYRPVWRSSYGIDVALGVQPAISYAIGLALFVGICLLVQRLGRELGLTSRVSSVGAALLAVSPIPLEAVTWVAGRTDLLAVFGVMLGLLFGLRSARVGGWVGSTLGVAVAAALAFGSKESAVMLGPMLFLALFLRDGLRTAVERTWWLALATIGFWAWRAELVGDWIGGYAGRSGYATAGELLRLKLRTFAAFAFPLGDPVWSFLPDVATGVMALGVLALGGLAARRFGLGRAFLAGLGLAALGFVPIYSIDVGSAAFPGTRQFLLPAIGWAVVWAVMIESLARSTKRPKGVFMTASAVLLASGVILQQTRLAPYAEASRAMGTLREQVTARLSEFPNEKLLFHDLPERFGPALCAQNAFPSASLTPFASLPPNPKAQFLTDTIVRGRPLGAVTFQFLLDPSLRSFGFDRSRGELVERPFELGLLVVKGEFEVLEQDAGSSGAVVQLGDVRIEDVFELPPQLPEPGAFCEIRLGRRAGREGWVTLDLRQSQPLFASEVSDGQRFEIREGFAPDQAGLLIGRVPALRPFAPTGALLIENPRVIRLQRDPETDELRVAPGDRAALRLARYAQLYHLGEAGISLSERFELR